jgi:hypothetical protein
MSTDFHVHGEVCCKHLWTIWLITMKMVEILFHLMPLQICTFSFITNLMAMQMLKLKAALFIIIKAFFLKYWMVLELYKEWTI